MKLFGSVVTTLLIVGGVWCLALFQQNIAQAMQMSDEVESLVNVSSTSKGEQPAVVSVKPVEQKITTEPKRVIKGIKVMPQPKVFSISGVHKRIQLNEISQLWAEFNGAAGLQQSLKDYPRAVYVLYSAVAKDYQAANVTIGYYVEELKHYDHSYTVNMKRHQPLLKTGQYNVLQLADAWERIDYNRPLDTVLEVHQLERSGQIRSTQLFVSYQ